MTLKKKRMKWFQFGIKKNANGTRDTKTKKGSKGKQAKEIVAEYYSDDEEDDAYEDEIELPPVKATGNKVGILY